MNSKENVNHIAPQRRARMQHPHHASKELRLKGARKRSLQVFSHEIKNIKLQVAEGSRELESNE